jgi:hypothetical protein
MDGGEKRTAGSWPTVLVGDTKNWRIPMLRESTDFAKLAETGVITFTNLVADCAREACEDHFASRRGFLGLPIPGIQCLFDNNPYAADPLARDQQWAILRMKLAEMGIPILASGSYPPKGQDEQPGYTEVLLVQAPDEQQEAISIAWGEAIGEVVGELFKKASE